MPAQKAIMHIDVESISDLDAVVASIVDGAVKD
jgi:hypothetical protein